MLETGKGKGVAEDVRRSNGIAGRAGYVVRWKAFWDNSWHSEGAALRYDQIAGPHLCGPELCRLLRAEEGHVRLVDSTLGSNVGYAQKRNAGGPVVVKGYLGPEWAAYYVGIVIQPLHYWVCAV